MKSGWFTFRIEPNLKKSAQELAGVQGIPLAHVMRSLLLGWLERQGDVIPIKDGVQLEDVKR